MWRPGLALGAVMGHKSDGLDVDIQNGGTVAYEEMVRLGQWPTSYGRSYTPSGGTHDFIVPLRVGSHDAFAQGIDLKGGTLPDINGKTHRGFLFLPPTIKASKTDDVCRAYRWAAPPDLAKLLENSMTDGSGYHIKTIVVNKSANAAKQSTSSLVPGAFSDPFFDDHHQNAYRSFTLQQAWDYCTPYLEKLSRAPIGGINNELNTAAKVFSHFGEEFWSRYQAERWLLDALHYTSYDPSGPRNWLAEDTIESAFSSRGSDWKATLKTEMPQGVGAPTPGTVFDSFESMLVDASELDSLPDPEPLIDKWLFRDSTARLIGQPGSYKSFVAIDMACCVALGKPWHGRNVHPAPVLYVVGEGLSGYKRRISAWCKANDVDKAALKGRLMLTRGAVQIGSDMWNQLTTWAEKTGVRFIIGDTQSKMTIDSEENSNDDAKKDYAHLDALRLRTGATLLLLHHTGHPEGEAGKRGRGASTWRGAVDTELIITKVGERKSNLLCDRHKESESGFEVGVDLYPVAESLAVRISQEPSKTELQAWVEQQVAGGHAAYITQKELVEAARLDGLTVSNADKRMIFDKYRALVMQLGTMTTMGVVNAGATVPQMGTSYAPPAPGGQPW
jgi:hypothetical protein